MADIKICYSGPIVSRAEGRKGKRPNYFTGLPCENGHIDRRNVQTNRCFECRRIARRADRLLQSDAMREAERVAAARWRKEKPHLRREIEKRVSVKRLEVREAAAGRKRPDLCEVCFQPPRGHACNQRMDIMWDHCHKTGKFRGWICDRCNKILGFAKDSPVVLRKLAEYLEGFSGAL